MLPRGGDQCWYNLIDCECEDGRFPVPASCLKFLTPIYVPAVKQGLILEHKAGKSIFLI